MAIAAAVLAGTAAGATAAAAAPVPRGQDSASAGSILYRKAGSLWVVSPGGAGKHRIKHTKGLSTTLVAIASPPHRR